MRFRKFLALILALSLLVSAFPVTTFAQEAEENPGNPGQEAESAVLDNLFLDKTAELTDDGTYTINLEAYATGTTVTKTITEGVPLDVVLVMDQSGSLVSDGDMLTTLKSSVNAFLEELRANGEEYGVNHRVAIAGFASYGKQGTAGVASHGYSYANDIRDNAWVNTGIFVDGEFKDYGTVEYTKVQSASEISVNNAYSVKARFTDQTVAETFKVQFGDYYWTTSSGGQLVRIAGPYYSASTAAQGLYDAVGGQVYTVGDSVNQLTDADYAAAWENIADGENGQGSINPDITSAVDRLSSNGGTAIFMGMKMARRMLENLPAEADGAPRKKIVIVFTDGEPGPNGYAQGDANAALAEAARIKESGTEIYTIGIYGAASAETVETFMNQLSSNYVSHSYETTGTELSVDMLRISDSFGYSDKEDMYYQRNIDNSVAGIAPYFYKTESGEYWPFFVYKTSSSYSVCCLTDEGETEVANFVGYSFAQHAPNPNPDANYYLYAADISDLSGIFETISSDMTGFTSELSLDANAVLKDVLAEGFSLTDNTTVTVSVVPGSMSGEAITWGEAQEVLSFNYSTEAEKSGTVKVSGAADQTEMTLTAKVEGDTISVTGFNYAKAEDADQINAQYISEGHPGSKLVVKVTGVEAEEAVTTDAVIATNLGISGIYEAEDADSNGDGNTGELQASFPVPTTYLSSKTYYVDYSGSIVMDPNEFFMTVEGVTIDPNGYHRFAEPGTTIELENGTVTVRDDGMLLFTMNPGDWGSTDSFYIFGTTDHATVTGATANAGGNMWAKITVVTPKDSSGKLFLDKDATLTSNGTYTINLNAYATGMPATTTITEGIPLDVVLVIDQSGSLYKFGYLETLKASVNTFIETLYANGEANGVDHRVSICGFAADAVKGPGGLEATGYTYACKDRDLAWTNTGIFVDGEFMKLGTFDYTPIYDPAKVDPGRMYGLMWDSNEDGYPEMAVARIRNNEWQVWDSKLGYKTVGKDIKDEAGNIIKTREEDMMENHHVIYDLREVTNTLTDADYAAAWEHLAIGENGQGGINKDLITTAQNLCSNGSTYTVFGLKLAQNLLDNAPNDDGIERKKVVVVFTDGEPGQSGYTKGDADFALAEAMKIKEQGIEIYAVGMYSNPSANQENFMNRMSSNYESLGYESVEKLDPNAKTNVTKYGMGLDMIYCAYSPYFYLNDAGEYWPIVLKYENGKPNYIYADYLTDNGFVRIAEGEKTEIADKVGQVYQLTEGVRTGNSEADYYKYAKTVDELEGIFAEFAESMTTYKRQVMLDATAILQDVMADGFKLTDRTTVTVSVVPGSVSEENSNIPNDELTHDKITWGTAQKVLSFTYSQKEGTGKVVVNGAADQTEMTLSAKVEGDTITVTGFNYASAQDSYRVNAQYISAGHPGSKLVVTITGVEAKNDVVTDGITTTNKGASGIYEGPESDLDEDGETGEMQASFPIPTTYLSSKTYYVDYSGQFLIDPADFLMDIKGINADVDGYNYFATPGTTIELEHGTVTVQSDGKLLFIMDPGNWGITDTFYLFGTTNDSTVTGAVANADGNMWSKITIITPKDSTGKLFQDKTATLTGDGTYTIDLEAYATGMPVVTTISEGIPLDVVLVIDQSGSLMLAGIVDELQGAVSSFVNELKINGEAYGVSHRISVATYASAGTDGATGFLGDGFPRSESPEEGTNRLYPHWYNTGLFVNGKFKNYGTLEYIPVESVEAMGKQVRFLLDYDYEGDGIWERWVTDTASPWRFRTYKLNPTGYKNTPIKDANGNNITTNQALFDNYKLYTAGAATCTLTDDDYKEAWEYLAVGENGSGALNEDISRIIGQIASSGGTRTSYGMKMAAQLIKNCPDDGIERKKIVIVFSDGEPGQNTYNDGDAQAALAEAKKIKNAGVEIYTVGVYPTSMSTNAKNFMERLSSNYSDHTFSTKTTTLSTSGYTFRDTMGNAKLVMSKCFYKDEAGNYWPVAMSHPYDNTGMKRFYYITDEGEVTLQNSTATSYAGLYTLSHVPNKDLSVNYFRYSNKAAELADMLNSIIHEATSVMAETTLDATAILQDVMADGFTLTDNTTITVSVVPGSVSEENSNIPNDELTSDKITWGEAQQVLTFAYPAEFEKSGSVVVNGAADQTEMTLTAKATENGIITVTGFNYADPQDPYRINAQYIQAGHPGSKLVLRITGVEAKKDAVTDSITTTNKGTSGIYEGPEFDADKDGVPGEMQASFPIPTTYLSSKTYYLDQNNTIVIDPKDFLMTIKGLNLDSDGYHYFATPGAVIETEYGEVRIREDGKLEYTLTDNAEDITDIFYLFGTTKDATVTGATANTNGNMWSKIIIVPLGDLGGNLILDKEATLTDDGTYTIDLEAFATGTPTSTFVVEGIPLDVVLVVDQSGSLHSGEFGASLEDLKAAVSSFVNTLYANGEVYGIRHRISICGFAGNAYQEPTSLEASGYSYADKDKHTDWVNTGLFVDGEFKNYGQVKYTLVESPDELVEGYFYGVMYDTNGDGDLEMGMARFRSNQWQIYDTTKGYITVGRQVLNENGEELQSAAENLLANYDVWHVGESANSLTTADYRASWKYIAAGDNGKGGLNTDITRFIDMFSANSATSTMYGLKMARQMLANVPNDGIQRKQVVVVFTDGVPGFSGYCKADADAALAEAGKIKEKGIEIYGIALGKNPSDDQITFMNHLTSNYVNHSFEENATVIDMSQAQNNQYATVCMLAPDIFNAYRGLSPYFVKDDKGNYWPVTITLDSRNTEAPYSAYYTTDAGDVKIAHGKKEDIPVQVGDVYMLREPELNTESGTKYYIHARTLEELTESFGTVAREMTTYSIENALDATAILKDVMAEGFSMTDKTTVTVSVVPGSVKDEYASTSPKDLTADMIDWGETQEVLSFSYPAETEKSGTVKVKGAADQTEMTLVAKAIDNGTVTVTGFNYSGPQDDPKINAQYIQAGHPGSKLVVKITGVEADESVLTDVNITTNKGSSGIYEGPDSDLDEDGEKGEMQASFPIPTTQMASKVYVMDYAQEMTIDPSDFRMTKNGISLDGDGYDYFNPAATEITETYGKVAMVDGKITYKPTNMNWDGYDTFYVFGTTDNSSITAADANRNGNMWAKVSVIPANNVYYEDTFVTSEEEGTVGIIYTGNWEEVDASGNPAEGGNQGENAESGEDTTADGAQGGVHGWEDNLADDTDFTDGSAHVSSTTGATATFTFTGTGVDIYSRTNRETGIVMALLYEGDSTTDENGKNLIAMYSIMVDNLAASGDYFQVPTLSLCKIPLKVDGVIQKDENGNAIMTDLPYGTYTVKLVVSRASASQTGEARLLYYLDGIRVYNPIQGLEEDSLVSGAYGDKELNATFVEIRDKLLDAKSFSGEEGDTAGFVFIDRITDEEGNHEDNTNAYEIGTYEVFGPENEVYLSAFQMIGFTVEYQKDAHYYIGMKSLDGRPAEVTLGDADGFMRTLVISHTSDLYYEVFPDWVEDENGNLVGTVFVMTEWNGDEVEGEDGRWTYDGAILSLTKLKVTGPNVAGVKLTSVPRAKLLAMAEKFANTEPEADDTTPDVPEVDIENPGSDNSDDLQTELQKLMIELLKRIFRDLRGWFKP